MTELLSCPFCGGDVSFHKDEECPGCHLIQCGQCRAFFDFATGADPGNDCASVDALRAAIAPMWNTRAHPTQQGEAVEVVAWVTPEKDRVITALTVAAAREDGGAMLSSVRPYSVPCMTVAQHQRILAASVPAGCKVVPVERIAIALEAVQNAMEDAYNNAYQECCGRGQGCECCGNPIAAWSDADTAIMDALAPAQRELSALLASAEGVKP